MVNNASLLKVHSVDDYGKDGGFKNRIRSMTAGQQKPDKLSQA